MRLGGTEKERGRARVAIRAAEKIKAIVNDAGHVAAFEALFKGHVVLYTRNDDDGIFCDEPQH